MIIVPDAVEPYIGYKWLRVEDDDRLFSNAGSTEWPAYFPLEATCVKNWGHRWEIARSCLANIPYRGPKTQALVYMPSSRYETVTKRPWMLDGKEISKPAKKPKVLLGQGLAWSYEPIPCPHEPVAADCSCGIYAASEMEEALSYQTGRGAMVKVALWGRVIIGEKGARGQYAYPQVILGGKDVDLVLLAERYGIPGQEEEDATAQQHIAQSSSPRVSEGLYFEPPSKKRRTRLW